MFQAIVGKIPISLRNMEISVLHKKITEEIKDGWQVSEAAVQYFRESLPNILALVNDKFRLGTLYSGKTPHTPEEKAQAILQNLDFLLDAHRYFGEMLLAVYQFQLWHNLIDEAAWYAQSVHSRGLDERYFGGMLRTWIIALHSYIKPPEVNELARPIAWLSTHVQDLFQLDIQQTETIPRTPEEDVLSDKASDLLNLLFRNERNMAEELVNSYFEEQKSDEAILSMLFSVLSKIGGLWRDNQISVADEHLAVANLRMIYQSYFSSRSPEQKKEQKIAVCCVPGEEHEIGAEMLSLYLESKGWLLFFIGHNTPEGEILRMVERDTPFTLILSVTIISHLPALVSLAQRLRERLPAMKVLAGGNALRQTKEIMEKFVDGIPDSFEECHKMLGDMVNMGKNSPYS